MPASGVLFIFGVCEGSCDAYDCMRTHAKTGARLFLAILAWVFLFAGLAQMPARGQADPTMLGRAIDAVVQLSIVVRGSVDGEEQVIWYAVGSGTVVSPDG